MHQRGRDDCRSSSAVQGRVIREDEGDLRESKQGIAIQWSGMCVDGRGVRECEQGIAIQWSGMRVDDAIGERKKETEQERTKKCTRVQERMCGCHVWCSECVAVSVLQCVAASCSVF